MSRIFRVDLYPHEFLSGTLDLTPVQRGIYVPIIMLIYAARGPIKNDPAWIGRASNCSARLVRTVVDELVDKNKIQITSEGFITNSRCESVLKDVRTRSELMTNVRRTSSEKDRESNDSNDMTPTVPSHKHQHQNQNQNPPLTPQRGAGGLSSCGKEGFDVLAHLTEAGRMSARLNANGFDLQYLAGVYNKNVHDGVFDPPKSADAAFPVWCSRYTKGKQP